MKKYLLVGVVVAVLLFMGVSLVYAHGYGGGYKTAPRLHLFGGAYRYNLGGRMPAMGGGMYMGRHWGDYSNAYPGNFIPPRAFVSPQVTSDLAELHKYIYEMRLELNRKDPNWDKVKKLHADIWKLREKIWTTQFGNQAKQ